jgi:dihydroorotate dehydrogenase (NAD+) catalytic subunit
MATDMGKTSYRPIYDITKTYEENLARGPDKKYRASLKAPAKVGNFWLLGFKVNSLFGAAACPTGADSRYIQATFDAGFDIVTTKTRRSVHFAPNNFPNVIHIVPGKMPTHQGFKELPKRTRATGSDYETLTIANSYGNNSLDPEYWVPDAKIANSYAIKGKLLITSIVGTVQPGLSAQDYYLDFAKTALLAKASGAQAIEINLSCPNIANEGVLCYDPAAVLAVCQLVRRAVGKMPIIAKLGFFPNQPEALLAEVVAPIIPYINAISAINTFAAPILDNYGKQAMPGQGRLKAGISGHAIKDLGLSMTQRLDELRKQEDLDYQIIGIGGVLTAQDFQQYRQAGADAVLSATGAMWNPNLANEIKNSLAEIQT